MLLHDALDVLAADTDDPLVVLVRHMERDAGWHFLLDQRKSVLHAVVRRSRYINVEVVLPIVVKKDLNVALTHDFVDLAVLLATDKLFVLVGKLNLDLDRVLLLRDELDGGDDVESDLDLLVDPCDGEGRLLVADVCAGVRRNVMEHGPDLCRRGLPGVRLRGMPPCRRVELASQEHDFPHRPVGVDRLGCLYPDDVLPYTKKREHDISAMRLDDLAYLLEPTQEDAVDFGGRNADILHQAPHGEQEFVHLGLGELYRTRVLTCDEYLGVITTVGTGRTIAVHRGERRREIDGCISRRLDELDVLAVTTTDELVKGVVKLHAVHDSTE